MAVNINKDVTYRAAKPQVKDYFINDGGGLNLVVQATGSKLWRFVYSFEGKRRKIAFGPYPATSLESARKLADAARQQIAEGIDPGELRKQEKAAKQLAKQNQDRQKEGQPIVNSFAHVATEWLTSIAHSVATSTNQKKTSRFKTHVFPVIGSQLVGDIKSPDIFAVIKPLISKGQLETAHRVHAEISAAFSYAIAHGICDYDPAQAVARQLPPQKVKHRAALIDPKDVGQLLRDIYNYQGTYVVQMALRLSPMLFQRPGEIRQMLWEDVDLIAKEWRPYVSKTDYHHIVPLPTQAVDILEAIQPLTLGGKYVFPSCRGNGRPMSDGTIITALKALGYDSSIMTAHGFRTTASTLLNEQGWSPDAIERQLAHAPRDQVRAAYNRAQYLDERRRMMQAWADYLDALKKGADVISFKRVG